MNECDNLHPKIFYESKRCPMCRMIKAVMSLSEEIGDD